jgi:NAD(P)-dependent dehydrogenase (short-subunit alcohol dehydrogenase family)
MESDVQGRPPLEDKVAVVIGASRGIGAAVARAFVHAGASVALAARDGGAFAALAGELTNSSDASNQAVLTVPTDVTNADAVARLVERIVEVHGRLDVACNNAGSSYPPTALVDVTVEQFDASYALNQRGVFVAMRHEIPVMVASGGGAIVNMSSTAGLQAVGGLAGYVSTKFGVEGLTRVAALDYAAMGVRVNAIAPGPILTDNLRLAGPGAQHAVANAMPIGRIGQPDEVAAAAVWLCLEAASFVTGATLQIDGGRLAGDAPFSWNRAGELADR